MASLVDLEEFEKLGIRQGVEQQCAYPNGARLCLLPSGHVLYVWALCQALDACSVRGGVAFTLRGPLVYCQCHVGGPIARSNH